MSEQQSQAADGRRLETGGVRPIGEDRLEGAKAIAEFIGTTQRRVYFLATEADPPRPPIVKEGGRLVARKTSLLRFYDDQERKAMEGE